MSEILLYEVKNGIATITLNRPDRYNAFDNALSFEFIDALKQVRKDPDWDRQASGERQTFSATGACSRLGALGSIAR